MAKKKKKKPKSKKTTIKKSAATEKAAANHSPEKPPIQTSPMPTAGDKITDFEETLDNHIKEKPKHGGARPGAGRPPKDPPQKITLDEDELLDQIAELLKMPFDIWAARTGIDHLSLSNSEAQMIAKPTQTLLNHYAPNLSPIGVAWTGLSLSLIAIMRGRLVDLREIRKAKIKSPSDTGFNAAAKGSAAATSRARRHGFPTVEQVQPVEAK